MISNNPPVIVELDSDLADFVIENSESNIEFSLKAVSNPAISRETAEKLVALIEKFKRVRSAVLKAREP